MQPISRAAVAAGPNDENVSFFVQVFKTHIGDSPHQWRQFGRTKGPQTP